MIKKIITIACLIGLSGALSSCYTIKKSATQHHISTEKLTESTKTGKACAFGFMVGPFGDLTIETARRNGGITQINSVENSFTTFLGAYKICTIVVGN
jgi:hypothetical protein